jgi:periplasmic divalent cation tolerance protein
MNDKGMLIMTTVDSEELAGVLASALLERRLAACVQEVRINSRYRWKGELRRDAEFLLLVKTSKEAAEAAMERIRDIHRYEVPEIIAVPITAGLPAYLEWLAAEANGAAGAGEGTSDKS